MSKTFFFYDLETSGLNPREARIMQFAGFRTDLDLSRIGDDYNILVKLSDDTLPSPEALMVTGITPQQTLQDGISESEFSKILQNEIFTNDTISVGFNNIRFDDEFIRYLFWRNFYDPYEWAWKNGRSRWDMLDVVRITRALRPDGIEWPIDGKGVATNRLELITKLNGIDHYKAHDALSDVEALVAVTRLIKERQPQIFDYLLKMRDKNEIKKLVNLDNKQAFVYVSGRYEAEYNKATVAFPLTSAKNGNVLVYDLRYDPTEYQAMSIEQLKTLFFTRSSEIPEKRPKKPIKELQYNRSPAVAPLGVLAQEDGWTKIGLDIDMVERHKEALLSMPDFAEKMRTVFEERQEFEKNTDPESQLYDGFIEDIDKMRVSKIHELDENGLADYHPNFIDERLDGLLLHFKARNFPRSLSQEEVSLWEKWRGDRIMKQLPGYLKTIEKLSSEAVDNKTLYLLQELHLWAESIMPSDDSDQLSLID